MPAGPIYQGITDGVPSSTVGSVFQQVADGVPPVTAGAVFFGEADGVPIPVGKMMATGTPVPRNVDASSRVNEPVSIDATVVASHGLFTVPTGRELVLRYVVVRCTAASSVTVTPKITIDRPAGPTDVFSGVRLHGLHQAFRHFVLSARGGAAVIIGSEELLRLVIDEGATAVSQSIEADVMGYLRG